MHIGLDFGTTNSGAAVFSGQQVRVLSLDPASHDPTVIRSTLYITREHEVFIGREAIDTYYRQNIGRPSKMVRRYVGEIEMTFAELPTFVKDVHVMVDELTPGRLLRSLKSGLATGYEGTMIFGRYYTLEELIALYLEEIRRRAEAETGQIVDGVVLGRPVNFVGSDGESGNRRAEKRLRRAAQLAGFEKVTFDLEPVAAAMYYELMIDEPQNIVVFDFGGGTLDITVMRVGESGPSQDRAARDRRVFASGGLDIAGDIFDQRVIETLMLEHFGRESTFRLAPGEKETTFPSQYTDVLINWQAIPELNRPETLHFFQQVQLNGSHPARVRALESLLVNNYAVRMYDEVERAKIALSDTHFALIRLTGDDIDLWQPLTRSQFESLVVPETERIETCLLDTLKASGLQIGEIDAVVRTGGSAQIPCFVQMLERIFGGGKVVLSQVFSGVTAGLAVGVGLVVT